MECKFESCEIRHDPEGPVFGDAIAAARAAVAPPDRIQDEAAYTAALRDALRAAGYCAAMEADDPRVSPGEVAVWAPADSTKEHWDVVLASGDTRFPFMVARGHP